MSGSNGLRISHRSPCSRGTPGLVTSLVEQLGLKLESSVAAVGVLVVESIDRPAELRRHLGPRDTSLRITIAGHQRLR
jgi:hypothetical protein